MVHEEIHNEDFSIIMHTLFLDRESIFHLVAHEADALDKGLGVWDDWLKGAELFDYRPEQAGDKLGLGVVGTNL